jgi:hypothetical protein
MVQLTRFVLYCKGSVVSFSNSLKGFRITYDPALRLQDNINQLKRALLTEIDSTRLNPNTLSSQRVQVVWILTGIDDSWSARTFAEYILFAYSLQKIWIDEVIKSVYKDTASINHTSRECSNESKRLEWHILYPRGRELDEELKKLISFLHARLWHTPKEDCVGEFWKESVEPVLDRHILLWNGLCIHRSDPSKGDDIIHTSNFYLYASRSSPALLLSDSHILYIYQYNHISQFYLHWLGSSDFGEGMYLLPQSEEFYKLYNRDPSKYYSLGCFYKAEKDSKHMTPCVTVALFPNMNDASYIRLRILDISPFPSFPTFQNLKSLPNPTMHHTLPLQSQLKTKPLIAYPELLWLCDDAVLPQSHTPMITQQSMDNPFLTSVSPPTSKINQANIGSHNSDTRSTNTQNVYELNKSRLKRCILLSLKRHKIDSNHPEFSEICKSLYQSVSFSLRKELKVKILTEPYFFPIIDSNMNSLQI